MHIQSYSWSGSQQRLYRDMLEPVNKVRNFDRKWKLKVRELRLDMIHL
jgi:hypothetical protein